MRAQQRRPGRHRSSCRNESAKATRWKFQAVVELEVADRLVACVAQGPARRVAD
jgi:hypothetical protein